MRPFHLLPTDVLFEAGQAAKLSSVGAQLGEFTTLRLTLAGGTLLPSPLDAFGFSILATSAPCFLPCSGGDHVGSWGPDPHFIAMGVEMCTDPRFWLPCCYTWHWPLIRSIIFADRTLLNFACTLISVPGCTTSMSTMWLLYKAV